MASTALEPHSCVHCQKIILHHRPDPKATPDSREMNLLFDFSLFDIEEAAAQRCRFCKWILEMNKSFLYEGFQVHQYPSPQDLLLCANIKDVSITQEDLISFGLWSKTDNKVIHEFVTCNHRIGICATADDPASGEILTRPINSEPSSAASWELARNWIDECLANHPQCISHQPTTLPSRVIDISKDGASWHVQLVCDQEGRHEPYAALSYCWGPSQSTSLRTTKGNIDSMSSSIPWQLILKTMQDAIITTHELGLHYLWIDALSIIQDDEEDKTQEISRMPHIYGQATVVIAATRAADVSEGFLHDRIFEHKETFKLPYLCNNGALGSVVTCDPQDRYRAPLDNRAWALQERLLASRVLEYGAIQTRSPCKRRPLGPADGWIPHAIPTPGRVEFLPDSLYLPIFLVSRTKSSVFILHDWTSLIDQYTLRSLTIQSDRILAISAIAEAFANGLDDHYLAGLWESSLPAALLWSVTALHSRRPQEYQGPSWSWVSIMGRVHTFYGSAANDQLKVIDTDIRLVSPDAPFGAIQYGAITVNGRMKSAEWRANTPLSNEINGMNLRHVEESRVISLRFSGSNNLLELEMHSDAFEPDFQESQWVAVFLLLVRTEVSAWDSLPYYRGIVLRSRDDNKYSRLGIFTSSQDRDSTQLPEETRAQRLERISTLFDDCEPQTITII